MGTAAQKGAKVYTLRHGVEGLGALEGTWEEIRAVLDGYPFAVVQSVFLSELMRRTELYHRMLGYFSEALLRLDHTRATSL